MSSSSLEKASLRLPWGRAEVMVAVEAIVVVGFVGGELGWWFSCYYLIWSGLSR